jgi:hypothetical protein
LIRLALIDLAIFQSGIYLHLAKHETAHPVLTMNFFVPEIHLTAPQTEHSSRLLDGILCQGGQLFVVEVNQDTSHRYADCERHCETAPIFRMCNFG